MKLSVRSRPPTPPAGLVAPARVDRRTSALLARLRPGDVAVVDHVDLDRATAQALVERRVAAVVNAEPMISGRFPNLGPQVLVDAGVPVVDAVGADLLLRVRDGADVRLLDGALFVGDELVATGRVVDAELVREEMEQAGAGLVAQLDSFTRNSVEFLRREEDLLLHGLGLPALRTAMGSRPVVVVVRAPDSAAELAGIERFVREQGALLVGVQRGADVLLHAGLRPHVVVLDSRADEVDTPSAKALRAAKDVVLRVDPGSGRAAEERIERLGIRPLACETGASPEDVALLLAHRGEASVVVGVGLHATLEEFLDRQRPGLASTYLTRLAVGERLVDARTLPGLYSGRVRPRHVFWVLLAGLAAVLAAIAVTPVGQQWAHDLLPVLRGLLDDLQGLFS
ncbi:MAG: putative cytokinetic ring protein SteA [Nocardioidaceae bacterium]